MGKPRFIQVDQRTYVRIADIVELKSSPMPGFPYVSNWRVRLRGGNQYLLDSASLPVLERSLGVRLPTKELTA